MALLLSSISHAPLSLLVGAHGLPLLRPFTGRQVAFPFGLLPSAGRQALDSCHRWRNLLIERGILVPLFALPAGGHRAWRHTARAGTQRGIRISVVAGAAGMVDIAVALITKRFDRDLCDRLSRPVSINQCKATHHCNFARMRTAARKFCVER